MFVVKPQTFLPWSSLLFVMRFIDKFLVIKEAPPLPTVHTPSAHTCALAKKEVTLYSISWLISHFKCTSIVHITCDTCISAPICYRISAWICSAQRSSKHDNMIRVGYDSNVYIVFDTLLCVFIHMRNILIKLCRQFMSLHAKIMVQCTHTVLRAAVCLPFKQI